MYTPDMMHNNLMYNNYAYLTKTDTKGNEQWNRTFENIGLKNAYSVLQTDDGGYILGGMEVDFVQPSVSANNTSIEEVRGTPEKTIPGFGLWTAVVSMVIVLFRKRRTLGGKLDFK